MSLAYIRRYYGIPAEVGRRVKIDGKPGVIADDRQSPYIYVLFDGDRPGREKPCHPTWKVEYEGIGTVPKLTRSQERYRRYLKVSDCFESFRDFLAWEQIREIENEAI